MNKKFTLKALLNGFVVALVLLLTPFTILAQQSVARQWNECNLNCIRKYFAKPTVHARNLFHTTVVMYDAWAVYDDDAAPFFLGNTWGDFYCEFNGIPMPEDGNLLAAQEEAISYAMYRTLWNRYTIFAPGANLLTIQGYINAQMSALGYDPSITSTDYSDGDPAKLGNYIAAKMQEFALQDGSNQQANYANLQYQPINGQLSPQFPGNPYVTDPNRWQALVLSSCIDQNGVPVECPPGTGAAALSPEWGNVVPFALEESQSSILERENLDWKVYLDPGAPPYLDTTVQAGLTESFFKWGYVMNIIWHSFHNNDDGVMIDASPNNIGGLNITDESQLPETFEEYQAFYDLMNGGVHDPGHDINPVTGLPYEEQMVPRKDFTRVLSQYWADGPNSETPPGHWFKLFNEVADHPMLEKKWMGQGETLSDLEWDVRGYFALGGGIHDAAIACWSAKGYYDYTRPIMAIRWMGVKGQCTDPMLPHYHPAGLPLIPGYIELVETGDELAGENDENVNKIKVYSWKGPVAATGLDGAGWLLAENWWTYQTAGFVTPPFPGYYSGHSTYSRTGAELMTLITGDEYFPGGMSEFVAPANSYLLADSGPSVDVKLQWATYRDASDQCSASRIYGGLHPPQDDIPGRKVGLIIGPQVFEKANSFMTVDPPRVDDISMTTDMINDAATGAVWNVTVVFDEDMNQTIDPTFNFVGTSTGNTFALALGSWTSATTYNAVFNLSDENITADGVYLSITGAEDLDGNTNIAGISTEIHIDTENPMVSGTSNDILFSVLNDDAVMSVSSVNIEVEFSEPMDINTTPVFNFADSDAANSLVYNATESAWNIDGQSFTATFDLVDNDVDVSSVDITTVSATDINGNIQVVYDMTDVLEIDTKNPSVAGFALSNNTITDAEVGSTFTLSFTFDEAMNTASPASISFPEGGLAGTLVYVGGDSGWDDAFTYTATYVIIDENADIAEVDVMQIGSIDENGNDQITYVSGDVFSVDTKNPEVLSVTPGDVVIADANDGLEFTLEFVFDDEMNTEVAPVITFANGDPLANTLTFEMSSDWLNSTTYQAVYTVNDANEEIWWIDALAASATDDAGNSQNSTYVGNGVFSIDTRNPEIVTVSANTYNITSVFEGPNFTILTLFDEEMDGLTAPVIGFPVETPPLTLNLGTSGWINPSTYKTCFDVPQNLASLADIDISVSNGATDAAGNLSNSTTFEDFFSINMVVAVDESSMSDNIMVYPNPATAGQDITLQWNNMPASVNISIYNSSGQLVRSKQTSRTAGNLLNIDTNMLSQGLYYFHVNSDMGSSVFSVSIVH